MKTKLSLIILTMLITTAVLAQAPEKFKYQGVVHDNNGNLLINKNISLQISLLQGSATGTAVYIETHDTTTNQFGLFNITVGAGTVIKGNFSTIPWNIYKYFQKVEVDTSGGSNFILMGTSPLLSVPYALNAQTSENTLNNGFSHFIVFDTRGTYVFSFVDTHNQGMNYMIEVWGGGGGGGFESTIDSLGDQIITGCGGGGGGYGKTIIRVDSGGCYVTVGAGGSGIESGGGDGGNGGTSSFGTFIYATGGEGGIGSCTPPCYASGGISNGVINISGGTAFNISYKVNQVQPMENFGGNSPNGGSGGVYWGNNGIQDGTTPGGGGAWLGVGGQSSGRGADGRVIVYW
jgi:hypothetical protein